MAKRTVNRRELREQAEAAEKQGSAAAGDGEAGGKKKGKEAKKAAPKAKRSKAKVVVRKRLLWGVFSSSMKEEGRFSFFEREEAENRAAELTAKHKRTYFIHPIKEPIADKPVAAEKG
jgi:hypothetical protein